MQDLHKRSTEETSCSTFWANTTSNIIRRLLRRDWRRKVEDFEAAKTENEKMVYISISTEYIPSNTNSSEGDDIE